MNAVLSGRTGVAVLLDNERFFSLHAEEPGKLVPRKPEDYPYFLGDCCDLEYLEGVSLSAVQHQLQNAVERTEALDLALIVLDHELPEEIRIEAARDLEAYSQQPALVESLESVLYAMPLPTGVDVQSTHRCASSSHESVVSFFRRLFEYQPAIRAVRTSWEAAAATHLPDAADRQDAAALCQRAGVFRGWTLVLEGKKGVDQVLLRTLTNPLLKSVHSLRQVLTSWRASIPELSSLSRAHGALDEEEELLGDEAAELCSSKRGKKRKNYDRALAKSHADSQKANILRLIDQGKLDRVPALMEELIRSQVNRFDGHRYACKSVCDLAAQAQKRGLFTLQVSLTARSVELNPEDGWAWTQHGKALLNVGRLQEALAACHNAQGFGGGVVAKTGRAEVLKALGRLEEALALYEQTSREHPENVVANNGRAEVLKALGRLEEALALYEQTSREHPENVVANNGRAEVLKALGRLEEALALYEQTSREHPEDVVAKTGRAEVLKALGRLEEALALYEQTSREHPEDVVANNGRAEVLKALGRLEEALALYEQTSREHPENVVANNGRAEVLKALGRLEEALALYEQTSREHPEDVVAKTGRAEVLKALGRLEEALALYEQTSREHPEDVVANNGRAEVLKALGRLEEALALYEQTSREHPEDVVAKTGRAEVLKALGRLEEALALYEQTSREHPENVVARNNRAIILFALQRSEEALALLPESEPSGAPEWVGYHIRGMMLLKQRRNRDARRAFEHGVTACPFPRSRDYFRTALALLDLRERDLGAAEAVLGQVVNPEVQGRATAVRVQVLGELNRYELATQAYAKLQLADSRWSEELYNELRIRYIDRKPPQHDDDWVLDRHILHLSAA